LDTRDGWGWKKLTFYWSEFSTLSLAIQLTFTPNGTHAGSNLKLKTHLRSEIVD